MEIAKVQVKSLFGSDVQYIIPLFQRHYVWDQEEQWEPLWKDIKEKAYQRLSEFQRQQFTHFTGTIVVQQKQTNVNEVQKYEIIDGQQRLTTFQVLLCVLRDICKLYEFERIEAAAEQHILNQGTLLDDLNDEQYKLIPTEFDRTSFVALADRRANDSGGQIYSTYNYFKNEISGYVNRDRNKMLALFHSILNDFGFVQILLDPHDEPERIFESLNARAKPLLQFDLLRNNLFLSAGERRDRLYRDYWDQFETPYWDPEDNSGTSSELFLQHFLMAKLGTEKVKPEFNIYQRQYRRELTDNQGIEYEFTELKRYAQVYRKMTDNEDDSEIGQRMQFYRTFDLTTLRPFILFMKCEVGLSDEELNFVFNILESYTIRRMLCCGGKRGLKRYNIFFSEIIKDLKDNFSLEKFIKLLVDEASNSATNYPADDKVRPALHTNYDEHLELFPDDSTIVFPNNQAVRAALHGLWVKTAGQIQRRLIRYILYQIEIMKRNERLVETDNQSFNDQLTLDHIMPIKWKETWTVPVGEGVVIYESDPDINYRVSVNRDVASEELFYYDLFSNGSAERPSRENLVDESYLDAFNLALVRDHFLQSIGNLTLVTGRLNASMSNRPFFDRRERLYANSLLILNREIHENNDWDVNEIQARAERLIADVCKIWPSLDWFAENLP